MAHGATAHGVNNGRDGTNISGKPFEVFNCFDNFSTNCFRAIKICLSTDTLLDQGRSSTGIVSLTGY